MDLFEYQGKQLFAALRHPGFRRAMSPTRSTRLSRAADAAGYPVVVKAQVQVGGRGKAGRHQARRATPTRSARTRATSSASTSRVTSCERVWVEHASDIAEEYYASFTLDRAAKKYLGMLSAQGGVEIETVAEENPDAIARIEVDPVDGLTEAAVPRVGRGRRSLNPAGDRRRGRHLVEALPRVRRRRRRPRRDQPVDPHARRQGARARRQGVARRQRAVPPSGVGRASSASRRSTRASAKPPRRDCSTSVSTATSA